MKETVLNEISVLCNGRKISTTHKDRFTDDMALDALKFHQSVPAYKETPLISLTSAAKEYNIGAIIVKDESKRFGLNAFKGLGGSYAMFRIICHQLHLDIKEIDYQAFEHPDIRKKCANIVFATATDGNHGKGVSWATKIFGCQAHVFMPAGTVEARRKAIESAGNATVEITEFNYDETVKFVAQLAQDNGWILIQDTAWDDYEEIPQWIMEGYLTLGKEITNQIKTVPTHIFLQAGVGSMAGCIAAYLINKYQSDKLSITIVEPEEAGCVYISAKAEDGMPHSIVGNPKTIMAGLNCGTPCKTIWPILRDEVDFYCLCKDVITEKGMYAYANPRSNDQAIISGESGAVTYGLLLTILNDPALRELFRIDKSSVVLLINTEGNTDPAGYTRVMEKYK